MQAARFCCHGHTFAAFLNCEARRIVAAAVRRGGVEVVSQCACPDHHRGRACRRDVGRAHRAVSSSTGRLSAARSRRDLSAITGANVSLTGPVELRLLPTPYLALGEGLVSAPGPDGAKLSFGSARLELALDQAAERPDPVLRHSPREARADPHARSLTARLSCRPCAWPAFTRPGSTA